MKKEVMKEAVKMEKLLKVANSMKIIFTDLDGTLLDEKYGCEKAIPIIKKLKKIGVPIVFVSAKTRFEQEVFRKKLGINDPFIVEDGSAIFFPRKYFGKVVGKNFNGYEAIVLGVKYEEIVKKLKELRLRYNIKSYSFMSVEEVAKVTGLNFEMARLAKMREFSETIVEIDESALNEIKKNFNITIGGRLVHVYGKNTDKGRAVKITTNLFRNLYGKVLTFGIGNSYTDIPMLKSVDFPALVKNPDGWIEVDFEVYKADGIATNGWIEFVEKFVLGGD